MNKRCLPVVASVIGFCVTALSVQAAQADQLPIFDAHIHYSHDAVTLVPPEDAVRALRKAGLRKALVSSSDDNGTQLLHDLAPDLIVPSLRPYRRRGETSSWVNDPTILDYVEANLAKNHYMAIGEFHAFGDDINSPVLQRIIALAKEHKLLLHAHSDAAAIDLIFETDPDALVLWAHSGFDEPQTIKQVLARHKNLWSDLAFRNDQSIDGKVPTDWLALFQAFPDRFMVGTDTFAPERWYYVEEHANYSREWISSLPADLVDRIAWQNAEDMIERVAEWQAE